MADLGQLPSTRILANSPGSTGGRRRGGFSGGWGRSGTTQQQTPQSGGGPPQPQTFAQMQQAGLARPAPPAPGAQQWSQGSGQSPGPSSFQGPRGVSGQYNQAVSNALQAPSRYDLPQVQQVRDALTSQLQQQYTAQGKQLDEQNARRGLSASSIGSGYQGDLAGQQATALANLNAQLIQGQAATSAGDLAASLGAGAQWQGQQNQAGQFQQSLAQQQLENQQQFGLAQAGLTGQYGGQQTLGGMQQQLAAQLGLGNLGLGQQQLAQQGQQFGQTFGQQQLENQQQYGLAQAQQALAAQLGLGNLANQQQQTANQAGQFGQSLAQQQLEAQQQYGLSQQQQDLARQLGLGNLGLGQAQLAQSGQQFQQNLAQQALENAQQYGISQGQLTGSYGGAPTLAQQQLNQTGSQFQQQLMQQLGIATMEDRTSNRNVDVQAALSKNDMMLKIMSILSGMGIPVGTPSNNSSGGNSGGNTSNNTSNTGPSGGWSWPTTDQYQNSSANYNYIPNPYNQSFTTGGSPSSTTTPSNALPNYSQVAPPYLPGGSSQNSYNPYTGAPSQPTAGQQFYNPGMGYGTYSQANLDAAQAYGGSPGAPSGYDDYVRQYISQHGTPALRGFDYSNIDWAGFNPAAMARNQNNSFANAPADFLSGLGPTIGRAMNAPATPQYEVDPATGNLRPAGSSSQSFGQPRFLINGLEVNQSGNPVQGGYNALSDITRQNQQQGFTPGYMTANMRSMVQSNPNLLYSMFPNVSRDALARWAAQNGININAANPYGSGNPYA